MKWLVLAVAFATINIWCHADTEQVVIGQPTIFWHEGEWQTYKDGVWTPYSKSADQARKGTDSKKQEGRGRVARSRQQKSTEPQNVIIGDDSTLVLGQPNIGIGQPNVGIGERNGIGQTTIGIGQPTIGIGQTTIGIGQPNMGIGQTTIGIGKPNTGIGQTTIGIGQRTVGIGKPNTFFPQPGAEPQRERPRHAASD